MKHSRALIVIGGWACLQSWPYATFMGPSLGIANGVGSAFETMLWEISLACLCLACVAMAFLSRRFESGLRRLPRATVSSIALAVSCVAMATCRVQPEGAFSMAAGIIGAVVSGLSSGYLLVAWQKVLSALSLNEIDAGIPLGYGASLLLGMACAAAGPVAGTALSACMICISAWAFSLGAGCDGDMGASSAGKEGEAVPPMPVPPATAWLCTGITVVSVMVPLVFVESNVIPARDVTNPAFMLSILCGALVAGVMGYVVYRRAVRIDMALTLRICAPLAVASILAVGFAPAQALFLAQVIGFAANTLMHMHLHVAAATVTKLGEANACQATAGYLMPLYLATALCSSLVPALNGLGLFPASLLLVAELFVAGIYIAPFAVNYRPLGTKLAEENDARAEEGDAWAEIESLGAMQAQPPAPQPSRPVDILAERYGLTKREREVLEPFMAGRDSGWIREQLGISRDTVNTHLKHIYTKMAIHSKRELLDIADALVNETEKE